jgi:hypothetical protein
MFKRRAETWSDLGSSADVLVDSLVLPADQETEDLLAGDLEAGSASLCEPLGLVDPVAVDVSFGELAVLSGVYSWIAGSCEQTVARAGHRFELCPGGVVVASRVRRIWSCVLLADDTPMDDGHRLKARTSPELSWASWEPVPADASAVLVSPGHVEARLDGDAVLLAVGKHRWPMSVTFAQAFVAELSSRPPVSD